MIARNPAITRRHVLAGVAGLSAVSGVIATSSCSAVPSTSISVASVLFIPAAVDLVVNFLSTHFVDPMVAHLSDVAPAAEAAGANRDVCLAASKLAGGDFVMECLKDKVPIWASYNQNVDEASSFTVTLKSHSSEPEHNGGQIVFGLKNLLTGNIEKRFWGDAFQIPPYETRSIVYGPYKRYSLSPGPKKIVVLKAPESVSVSEVEMAILPMSIRV